MVYRLDEDPHFSYVYILPPILYPDGHYYVKIGGDSEPEISANKVAIEQWFHSERDTAVGARLKDAITSIIPVLESAQCHTKPCIVADAPNEKPIIDAWIADKVYVVTGCCGASAKSSNEIGRLAAQLMTTGGIDDPGLTSDSFAASFR